MHFSGDFHFLHYADDTTLVKSGSCLSQLVLEVNQHLVHVGRWICANRLSLNVSKTKFMLFTNKINPVPTSISIGGEVIERTDQMNFLGILMDSRLAFSDHIKSVSNKVSRGIGIIRKLSYFIPKSVLRTLYFALVYPHLTYGIEIFGFSSKTQMSKLDSLLNRCVKLLCGGSSPQYVHYKLLNLLSLRDIARFFCLMRFFRYYVLETSSYFMSKYLNCLPTHNRVTRFRLRDVFNAPEIKLSCIYNSFFYNSMNLFGNLPPEICQIETLYKFKKSLRNYLLVNVQN